MDEDVYVEDKDKASSTKVKDFERTDRKTNITGRSNP